MPVFRYKGYRPDGARTSGTIEADGLQDAVAGIKELNIFPKEVREYVHTGERKLFKRDERALLPPITRQLSTLLSSGVSLIEALKSLSEENRGYWKGILVDIRERVSAGAGLARALKEYPKIFPEFYVNMVEAGEQSGMLDKVLARLADFLERQNSVQEKIRISMIYPVFMLCVGFAVLSFLFAFVIPKIVRIFEDSKSALPLITVILIGISNLFVHYWWLIMGLMLSAAAAIRKYAAGHADAVDGIKLRIPGGILQSLYYARFARTLGFLLEGGLFMLKALDLSARSIGNTILEARVREAARGVEQGAKLSTSLEGFPPVLLQLIATGERGGRLAEVLNKAADAYEEEFGRKVQRALSLLEPSMILIMGLMVGFIVLAVLLPIFQLNQIVK